MAVKIKYDVNNNELKISKELIEDIKKELKLSDEQADKLGGSFKGVSTETKKTKISLADLKGSLAKLGIAAAIGAGIKAFISLQKEIIKNRKETALLTGQTGASLDRITAKALATAKVFDKDYNEVVRTANALSKEFGIGYTDALDQINEGFVRGVDVNGEYLDSLREYSVQAKAAGFNQKELIELLSISTTEGIFSDKGIDTIKEATERIGRMEPSAKAALDSIGLSSTEIEKSIEDGTKSVADIIRDVSKRLSQLPPQSKTTALALEGIFGTPGVDAGLRFVTLLKDVDGELGDVNEETKIYIEAQQRTLKAQENLNLELVQFSNNFKTTGNTLIDFVNNAGAGALRIINDFIESFTNANVRIAEFSENIQTLTLQELREELSELEGELTEVAGGQEKVFSFGEQLAGIFGAQREGVEKLNTKIQILRDRILGVESGEIVLGNTIDDTTDEIDDQTQAINSLKKALEDAALALENLGTKFDISVRQDFAKSVNDFVGGFKVDEGIVEKLIFGGKEADQIAQEQEDALNKGFEIGQKFLEKRKEQEQIQQEQRLATREAAIEGFIELENTIFDIRQNNLQRQLDQLELQYQTELELAGNNTAAKEALEEEFANKIKQLRQRQARNEKAQAVFSTTVNTARAVVAALTSTPPNIPLSIIVGGIGLAQLATIISQPIPQFHKGTKSVPGYDTSKDSVPAMLTSREMVIDVPTKKKYYPALDAIFDHRVPPELINSFVQNPTTNYHKEIIRDSVHLNIDRHGFSLNQRRNLSNYRKQVNRYRFA